MNAPSCTTILLLLLALAPSPVTAARSAVVPSSPVTPGLQEVRPPSALVGAWEARTYHLASGEVYTVRGRIFFTDRHWQVLFFVLDPEGEPRRGSAEGGGYTLEGDALTFRHELNLSYGSDLPGLPATVPRLTVRPPAEAVAEPARVTIEGSRMTLHFPSGNVLEFVRAS